MLLVELVFESYRRNVSVDSQTNAFQYGVFYL